MKSSSPALPATMQIEMWPIDRPIPYPKNARKWSDRAIATVAASIREYGFRQPIVVDAKDVIVIGHLRLKAAQSLDLKEVPVHVARDLSAAQIKGLRIADNRTNQESTWDFDLLAPELVDLKALDFDLALTGFDVDEIDGLLIRGGLTDGLTDEDAVPEPPATPVTLLGDLWLLGNHRVLCGDSTHMDAVERLMGGEKADMVFTDPPYGVNFGEANHNPRAKRWDKITNDDKSGEELGSFLNACFVNLVAFCVPAAPVYVWAAPMAAGYDMLQAMTAAGLHVQSHLIWVKNCIVLGQADYQWKHEPCWYGWTPGKNHVWNGGRTLSTVWEFSKDANSSCQHPAQKPAALSAHAIGNSSVLGAVVLDLFGGSGSTLIGCENTGRKARLMELEPNYTDVIVTRWQQFTGKQAIHDQTGRTFDDLAAERLGVTLRVPDEDVQAVA